LIFPSSISKRGSPSSPFLLRRKRGALIVLSLRREPPPANCVVFFSMRSEYVLSLFGIPYDILDGFFRPWGKLSFFSRVDHAFFLKRRGGPSWRFEGCAFSGNIYAVPFFFFADNCRSSLQDVEHGSLFSFGMNGSSAGGRIACFFFGSFFRLFMRLPGVFSFSYCGRDCLFFFLFYYATLFPLFCG